MRVNTEYGVEMSPNTHTIKSKTTRCYYCNQNEDKPTKYMEVGETCMKLVINAGPTGTAYICMKHAFKLNKELTNLLKSWSSSND